MWLAIPDLIGRNVGIERHVLVDTRPTITCSGLLLLLLASYTCMFGGLLSMPKEGNNVENRTAVSLSRLGLPGRQIETADSNNQNSERF